MSRAIVKICDVRTPEIGAACAAAAVDLVGIHCIWDPPSKAKKQQFGAIVNSLQSRCQTVLVTRQTQVESVAAMADAVNWNYIQLHARWNPADVLKLRGQMRNRGLTPKIIGVVCVVEFSPEEISKLEDVVDALVIDTSFRGGTGIPARGEDLHRVLSYVTQRPFLIAGGLKPENVGDIIRQFNPWGVDVQSGVEQPYGSRQKDVALINEFVSAARCCKGSPKT